MHLIATHPPTLDRHAIAVECALGTIWLVSDDELITGVRFEEPVRLSPEVPKVLRNAKKQLEAYFDGKLKRFNIPLRLQGSDHQKRVWEMVANIPYGTTITYAEIARELGGNIIARSVGNACGANPFPIIIPCHRVVASNGKLTGYLGGLAWKRWLLEMEGAIPQLQELF